MGRETLSSEFGRLCYVAYVFYPSITIRSLNRYTTPPQDEILKRTPPIKGEIQALVGTRFLPGDSERLGLKLRPMRATRGGAILARPCFCDGDDPGGIGILPPPTTTTTTFGLPPYRLPRGSNR